MFKTRYEKYIEFEELQKPTGIGGFFDFLKVAVALVPGVGPPVAGAMQATQTLVQATRGAPSTLPKFEMSMLTASEKKQMKKLLKRQRVESMLNVGHMGPTIITKSSTMGKILALKNKARKRAAAQAAVPAALPAYLPQAPAYLPPPPSDISKYFLPVGIAVFVLGGGFILLSTKKRRRRR